MMHLTNGFCSLETHSSVLAWNEVNVSYANSITKKIIHFMVYSSFMLIIFFPLGIKSLWYFICLYNSNLEISPLHWRSSVIDKVAEDIKTAETLALEKAIDDAIQFSNILTEIYTGKPTANSILIIANTDSKYWRASTSLRIWRGRPWGWWSLAYNNINSRSKSLKFIMWNPLTILQMSLLRGVWPQTEYWMFWNMVLLITETRSRKCSVKQT